ncbi:MAG: carboxypeptidase M32 [Myxococcota bacterium]
MHTDRPELEELRTRLRTAADLSAAASVLHWDQATHMPPGGAETRGRQMAVLGRIAHEHHTHPRIGELLAALSHLEAEDSVEGALVRRAHRDYAHATRLPAELVSEMQQQMAASYVAWARARPAGDFAAVRPHLERNLELSLRVADHFPEAEHPADPLIDESDPGMTSATVRALFDELRRRLVPLVERATARPTPDDSFLHAPYDRDRQLAFGRRVVERMGYDFDRGRQDETAHPFMIRLSSGDVRITTRVRDDDPTEALFSTVHEAGHALYEQGIDPAFDATPLGRGVSAGVHESQSRLWENMVARSRPFWRAFYPELQRTFPERLGEVDLASFHRAINRVARSLVRTDADEVTYNLHVMLRFDLEREMLEGRLAVADLPDAWNERMARDLGVRPPDHARGVLQDVHWFAHPIGGAFQGYTLGNLIAAQLFEAAERALPSLWEDIGHGVFDGLRGWLAEHVWRHGARFDPASLVERATGRPLSIEPLLAHLERRHGAPQP